MEPISLGSVDLKDSEVPEWLPPEGRDFILWLKGFVKEQRIKGFVFSVKQLRMVQDEAKSRGLEFSDEGQLVCPRSLH